MTVRPLRSAVPMLLCFVLALGAALPVGAGIERWTPFGPPNTFARILAVAVIKAGNPGTLLAAPESGGVYRSLDEGRSWSWSGDGLVGVQVRRLVVSPANRFTVYADGGALYRSDDAGQHWNEIYVPRSGIEALAADPVDPDVVYLADGPSLLRSSDRGETWERLFAMVTVVQAIAIDPTNTDRIYIGNLDDAFRSTDGGETWEVMDDVVSGPGFRGRVTALAVAPGSPNVVYMSEDAGFYQSTDGGQTWSLRSAGVSLLDLFVDPLNPSTLYGAPREGADVLVSRDAGANWKPVVTGKPSFTQVQDLAFAPQGRVLYVATDSAGVAWILRNGRLWQSGPQKGLPAEAVFSMQLHPSDPSRIYVRTSTTGRLFESRDGGRTWRLLTNPPVPAFFGELIFDPPHPDTLYLANLGSVYRSQDDGATWQALSGYPPVFDLVFPARRTVIAAGCGIHLSTDAGRTFREVLSCQIPDPDVENDRILTDLRADPGDRRTFYALGAVTAGRHPTIVTPKLYVSRDAGRTWAESLSGAKHLAIFPARNGPLYAFETVPSNARIRKSTDAGRTWQTFSPALPVPYYEVSDFEVDRHDPETLYLSTVTQGVYRSTDEGLTWEPINTGLIRFGWLSVHGLVMHPVRPHTLYALPQNGIFEGTFVP